MDESRAWQDHNDLVRYLTGLSGIEMVQTRHDLIEQRLQDCQGIGRPLRQAILYISLNHS